MHRGALRGIRPASGMSLASCGAPLAALLLRRSSCGAPLAALLLRRSSCGAPLAALLKPPGVLRVCGAFEQRIIFVEWQNHSGYFPVACDHPGHFLKFYTRNAADLQSRTSIGSTWQLRGIVAELQNVNAHHLFAGAARGLAYGASEDFGSRLQGRVFAGSG